MMTTMYCEAAEEFGQVTYYTLRLDFRKCAAPACGGYFLTRLNIPSDEETYVYAIKGASINVTEENQYILGGKISNSSNGFKLLMVTDVNRLAPIEAQANPSNVVAKPTYYRFSGNSVTEINSNQNTPVTNYTEPYSSQIRWIQPEWFNNRIKGGLSILSGRISNSILKIDKVFLHIPDQLEECPTQPIVDCIQGYIPAYKRDANRCKLADGCAKPSRFCPTLAIVCNQGYSIVKFFSKSGCYKFYCDPSFLIE